MTFTFHSPRKLEADEISPWNNLLGKAMASYNAMTDTQYKEPNLREALLKAQLANQYYGPDKESQMALRGKQGEHLGSLTQGQNISNQFAPEAARQAAQARAFGLKHPGFNSAGLIGQLQQYKYAMENGLLPNMPGNQNQSGQQSEGQALPQGMQSPDNQSFIPSAPGAARQPQQNPTQQGQQAPMNPVLQSILKMNQAAKEDPAFKRAEDLKANQELENYKTQQKEELAQNKLSIEEKQAAKKDLPQLLKTQKALIKLLEIAKNPKNAEMFGHYFPGGAAIFSRTSANPNVGSWQKLMEGPVMAAEQNLSSKGNQLALKTALTNKANMSEQQPVAIAKLEQSLSEINDSIAHNQEISGNKTKYSANQKVRVQMPDGTVKVMTHKEAKALGAE